MTPMWRPLAAVVLCLGAALTAGAVQQSEPVSLDVLLGRAVRYLDDFVRQFSNVVSEEQYVQNSTAVLSSVGIPGSRGGVVAVPPIPQPRYRRLKSDFLLVALPEGWLGFRDVFEVDGVPVRDREERLTKLFLRPTGDTIAQAKEISDEGARYNIGSVWRTTNNPVFALALVEADVQPRVRFTLGRQDKSVGADVWIVEYRETSGPTVVRGSQNQNLFAHGRLWIEATTGRFFKTEVLIEQPAVRAQITTSFEFNDQFGIAVPVEMNETYTLANGSRILGTATYGRFRRFDVTAEEKIQPPEGTTIER